MSNEIKRNTGIQDWQAVMRAALFDGVSESDMTQVVKSVVTKAKQGDLKAADFLFRWVIGNPTSPVVHVQQTHNVYREDSPAIDVTARQAQGESPDQCIARTKEERILKMQRNLEENRTNGR